MRNGDSFTAPVPPPAYVRAWCQVWDDVDDVTSRRRRYESPSRELPGVSSVYDPISSSKGAVTSATSDHHRHDHPLCRRARTILGERGRRQGGHDPQLEVWRPLAPKRNFCWLY